MATVSITNVVACSLDRREGHGGGSTRFDSLRRVDLRAPIDAFVRAASRCRGLDKRSPPHVHYAEVLAVDLALDGDLRLFRRHHAGCYG